MFIIDSLTIDQLKFKFDRKCIIL